MIRAFPEATMKLKALLMAAALLTATSAVAQNAQQDFSKVEVKTTKIMDKFYTLEGQGGMIGALVGSDGVFLVDTQICAVDRENRGVGEENFTQSHQVHCEHTCSRRPHRRQRKFCKTGSGRLFA